MRVPRRAGLLQRLILLCYKLGTFLFTEPGGACAFPYTLAHERFFFGARRARKTLCGLSRSPGAGRGARGSRRTTEILLQGASSSRRTEECRAHGGTPSSRRCSADASVPPSCDRPCGVE